MISLYQLYTMESKLKLRLLYQSNTHMTSSPPYVFLLTLNTPSIQVIEFLITQSTNKNIDSRRMNCNRNILTQFMICLCKLTNMQHSSQVS